MLLFNKLKALVRRDTPFIDESNSLLFLTRYLIVLWFPYIMVIVSFCLYKHLFNYGLLFMAALFIYTIAFKISFHIRPRIFAILVCVATIVSSSISTYGFGWRSSFQNMIYIIFLLLWYDPMTSVKIKVLFSVILTAIIGALSSLTPFGGTILDPSTVEYKVFVFFNILEFSLSLSLVAFFYCTEYINVERNLRLYNKKLKSMAETDTLTKLMNRRYAEDKLNVINNENNPTQSISIAIGDIDFFKKINDTYGHECGDYVLSTLSVMFREHMDKKGFVARWGGEEFLFVFQNINGDKALEELEHLRRKVANTILTFGDHSFHVTMTFGLEEYTNFIGHAKTIESADRKLYIGKESGRNRVVF